MRDLATTDDDELAARIADEAGQVLMGLRHDMGLDDPRALGREGDRLSNERIMATLRDARPRDAVLSEEGDDGPGAPVRTGASRVWVVDPLDGTREYSEGRDDFAVHVALVVDGLPMVGAVALPGQGLVLVTGVRRLPGHVRWRHARRGRFASSSAAPDPPSKPGAWRRGSAPQLVPMGSAGAKTAAVLRGTVDAYVHSGGQYEWDSAAPVAVAHAYGAYAARLDGSTLLYNQPDPWLPDLLVCRPELSGDILDALHS